MKVNLCPTADQVSTYDLKESTAIAIDVLRATSCIVTALANGCQSVIPVYTPEEALDLKNKLPHQVLLGGERHSIKIPGFDLANSPREYIGLNFNNKKLIITTTNGTKAIKEASNAENLLIGSILNAQATAKKAFELNKPVTMICAGTKGNFSLDDFLTAGLIINELEQYTTLSLTDFAYTAKNMYENSTSLFKGLVNSYHGKELVKMGLEEDLIFCSQKNLYPLTVYYEKDEISVSS